MRVSTSRSSQHRPASRSLIRILSTLAVVLVAAQAHWATAQSYRSVQSGDWNQQATWARTAANPGTITSTLASAVVTGVGTQFVTLTEVQVGDQLYEAGTFALIGTVATVDNNGQVTLSANALVAVTGSGFNVGRSFPQLAADAATIVTTHTVALTSTQAITAATVNAGGVLNLNTAAVTLTLTGALTANGDIAGTGAGAAIVMNGGSATLGASPTTTAALRYVAAGNLVTTAPATLSLLEINNVIVTVPAGSDLTLTNPLVNAGGTPTLTVAGTFATAAANAIPGATTLNVAAGGIANLNGDNAIAATATVTNAGTINFSGNTPIAAGATLDFATAANTVNFNNATVYTLPVTTYRTLLIGALGAKDLGGTTIVRDLLTLNAALNVGANTLNLGDNGTFAGALGGTLTNLVTSPTSSLIYRGNAAQVMPSSVTALTNLTIGGVLVDVTAAAQTIAVSGLYTSEAGNIDWNNNTFELTGSFLQVGGGATFVSDVATTFFYNSAINGWTGFLAITAPNDIGTIRINSTGGGIVPLASNVVVNTLLSLEAGEFDINDQNLTIGGTAAYTRLTGSLIGSATSGLIFTTTTAPGSPIFFTTTLELERLEINSAAITVQLGSTLTISGTAAAEGLRLTAGILDLNSFSILASGNYIRGTGTFIGDAASSLTFSGAPTTLPQVLAFDAADRTLLNLTVNNAAYTAATPLNLGSVVQPANLFLTAGHLGLNAIDLNITGNYTRTGGFFVGNAASDLSFTGAGIITGALALAGSTILDNFTLDKVGQTLAMATAIQTNGTMSLTEGNLAMGAFLITVNGPYTRTNGNFVGSAAGASGLVFGGAGAITGPVVFVTTLQTGRLTMNRGGQTLVLGSNLTVSGGAAAQGLRPQAGIIDLNGFSIVASGNYIRTAGTFIGDAASSLTFSGAPTTLPQVLAFDAADQTLASLTVNNAAYTAATPLNLGSAVQPANLVLTAGHLGLNAQDLNITGNYTRTGGFFVGNAASDLSFTGAGTVTGELALAGTTLLDNFTLNKPGVTLNLASVVQVNGTTTLTAGNIGLQDAADIFTINGPYTRTGGNFVGGDGGLRITGTGAISGGISIITTQELGELTLDRVGFTLPLASNFLIRATGLGLFLTSGSLDLNGSDLTVNGGYTRTGGNFIGDAASDLSFGGTAAFTGELVLVTDQTLASLTLNRAAQTLNLGSTVIPSALNLTAGNLGLNGQNLDVAGAYTRATGNFVGNAASNLTFSGAGALAGQTLSFVVPQVVNDLVISNSVAQVFSLASDLTVDNTLNFANTLGQTQLQIAANTLTLAGNPIAGAIGNLLGTGASNLTITGVVPGHVVPSNLSTLNTLTITNTDAGGVGYTGPSTLTLNNLVIGTGVGFFGPSSGVDITVNTNITVTSGDIRLAGTSTLTHLGTSTITPGVTAFNNTGTSTVFYNGAGAQDVLNGQYANLTFNNNAKTFVSALVPNRLFQVSLNFDPGTGVHTLNGAIIIMNGAAPQVIQDMNSTAPGGGYGRLRIANTGGGVTLTESTTVGDTLDLLSGTFTVDVGLTLTLTGRTLALPTAGRTGNLVGLNTSTVLYNGTLPGGQPVIRGDYHNLTFAGGFKTLDNGGNIEVRNVFTPGALVTHVTAGSTFLFDGTAAQIIPVFNFTGAAGTGYNNVTLSNAAGASTEGILAGVLVSGTLTLDAGNLEISNAEGSPLNLGGDLTVVAGTLSGAGVDAGLRIVGGAAAPALTIPAITGLGYFEVHHARVAAVSLGAPISVSSPRGANLPTDATLRLRLGALANAANNLTLPADALILATGGTLTASPIYGATRCDILYTNTAAIGPLLPVGPASFLTGNEFPASGDLSTVSESSSIQVNMAAGGNTVSMERDITIGTTSTFTLTAGNFNIANGGAPADLVIEGDYARTGGTFDGIGTSTLTIGSGATSNVGGSILQVNGGAPQLGTLTLNILDTETLNMGNALDLQGNLVLTSGNVGINGQVLTMGVAGVASGTITRTAGDLVGGTTSTLIWLGTGNGQIPAGNATPLQLNTLTIDRTGAGNTITIGAGVQIEMTSAGGVPTNLNLTAGTFQPDATSNFNAQLRFNSSAAVGVTQNFITVGNNGAAVGFMLDPVNTVLTNAAFDPDWNGQHVDLSYVFTSSAASVVPYFMGREIPNATANALRRLTVNLNAQADELNLEKNIAIGSAVTAAPSVIGTSFLLALRGTLVCGSRTLTFPALNTTVPLLTVSSEGVVSCNPIYNNNVNLEYIGAIFATGSEVPGPPGIVNNVIVRLDNATDVLTWNAGNQVEVINTFRLERGIFRHNGASNLRFGNDFGGCNPAIPFTFIRTPDGAIDPTSTGTFLYSACNEYRVWYQGQSEALPINAPFVLPAPNFTCTTGAEIREVAGNRSLSDVYVFADAAGARTGTLTVNTATIFGDNAITVTDTLALDNTTTLLGILNVGAAQTLNIEDEVTGITAPTTNIGDITSDPTGTTRYTSLAAGQIVHGKPTGIGVPTTFYGNLQFVASAKNIPAVTIPYRGTFTPNAFVHTLATAGANGTLTGTSFRVDGPGAIEQFIPDLNSNVPNGGGYFNLELNRLGTAQASLSDNVVVGDSASAGAGGQLILNLTGANDSLNVGAFTMQVGAVVTRTNGAFDADNGAGTVWFSRQLDGQLVPRGEYANLGLNNRSKTLDGANVRVFNTFIQDLSAGGGANVVAGNTVEFGGAATINIRPLRAGGGYNNLTVTNVTAPPANAAQLHPNYDVLVNGAFTLANTMTADGRFALNARRLTLNGGVNFGTAGRVRGGTTSELFIGAGAIGADPLRMVIDLAGASHLQTLSLQRVGAASDLSLGSSLRITGTGVGQGLVYAGTNAANEFIFAGQRLELFGSYNSTGNTGLNLQGSNTSRLYVHPAAGAARVGRLFMEDGSALAVLHLNAAAAADTVGIVTRTVGLGATLTVGAPAVTDSFYIQTGRLIWHNRLDVQCGIRFDATGALFGNATTAGLRILNTTANGGRMYAGSQPMAFAAGGQRLAEFALNVQAGRIIPLGSRLIAGDNSANDRFYLQNGILDLNGQHLEVNGRYRRDGATAYFRGSPTSVLRFIGTQTASNASTEANDIRFDNGFQRLDSLILDNTLAAGGLNAFFDLDYLGAAPAASRLYVGDSLAGTGGLVLNAGVLNITDGDTLRIGGTAIGTAARFNTDAITNINAGVIWYSRTTAGQAPMLGQYGLLFLNNSAKTFAQGNYNIAGVGLEAFSPGSASHTLNTTGTGTVIVYNGLTAQVARHNFVTSVAGGSYFGLTLNNTTGGITLGATSGLELEVGANTGTGTLTLNMGMGGNLDIQSNTLRVNAAIARAGGTGSLIMNDDDVAANFVGTQGSVIYDQQAAGQVLANWARIDYGNLTFSNFNKTLPGQIVAVGDVFTPGTATPHTVAGNTVEFDGHDLQIIPTLSTAIAAPGYNNLTISNQRPVLAGDQVQLSGGVFVAAAYTQDPMINNGVVNLNNQRLTLNGTINFGAVGEQFRGSATSELFIGAGALTNPTLRMVGTVAGPSNTLQTLNVARAAVVANDITLGSALRIVGTAAGQGLQYSGSAADHEFFITGQTLEVTGRINWTATGANLNAIGANNSTVRLWQSASGIVQTPLFFEDLAQLRRLRVNLAAAADTIRVRCRTNGRATDLNIGESAALTPADSFEVLQGVLIFNNRLDIQSGINFGTNGFLRAQVTGTTPVAGIFLGDATANGARMVVGSQPIRFQNGGQRLAEFTMNVQTGQVIPLGSRLIAGDNTANDRFYVQNGILDLNGQHLEVNGRYRRDGINAYFRGNGTSVLRFIGTETASNATAAANDIRFQNGFQRLDSLILDNTLSTSGLNAFLDLDYAGAAPATSRLYVGDSLAGTGGLVLNAGVLNITDGDTLQIGGVATGTAARFNTAAVADIDGGLIWYSRTTAGQTVMDGQYGLLGLNNVAKTFPNDAIVSISGAGIGAFSTGTATHTLDVTGTGSTVRYNGLAATAQVVQPSFVTNVPSGGSYFNLTLQRANDAAMTLGTAANAVVTVGDSTASTGTFTLNLAAGTSNALALGDDRLSLGGPVTITAGTFTGGPGAQLLLRPSAAAVTGNFNFSAAPELLRLRMMRTGQTFTLTSGLRVGQSAGTGSLDIGPSSTVAIGANTLTVGNKSSNGTTGELGTWDGGTLSAALGTVVYDATADGQRLIPTAYNNLTLSNGLKIFRNGGTPAGVYGIANVFTPGVAIHNVTTNATITINYNGAGNQTIADFNTDISGSGNDYPALTLSGGGIKTFAANAIVTNTFTLNVVGGSVALGAGQSHTFVGPMTYTAGTITGTPTSSMIIEPGTGGALTGIWPFTVGGQSLQSFTINRAGQRFQLGTDLTIDAGTTALSNGTLGIGANSLLTITGPITQSNGRLAGSGTSSLTISGVNQALPSGTVLFQNGAGDRELNNFTFTRTGTPNTFSLNHELSVGGTTGQGTLTIGNGSEVAIAGQNLTLTGGINLVAGGTFRGGVTSTLTVGGVVGSIALNIPTVTDNINNLRVNNTRPTNPPTAQLAANLTVLNQISLVNGVIGTSLTNLLTLGTDGATGVVEGGNSNRNTYVSGPLRKFINPSSSFRFPIGSEGRYRQAELFTTAGTPANSPFTVDLRVGNPVSYGLDGDLTAPVSFNVSKLEHHRVTSSTGMGAAISNIRLWWGTTSVVSTTPSDWEKLFISRWSGTAWDSTLAGGRLSGRASFLAPVGGTGTSIDSGYVTSRVGSTFSTQFFAISSTDVTNPLPVTWLTFTGRWDGPRARLDWSTANELNNERFEVERSTDQQAWSRIGTLPGSGTTNQVRNYAFVDPDVPGVARIYYRIRQVDLDGTNTTSNVIVLDRAMTSVPGNAVTVYPNPFQTGTLNIVGAFSPAEQQGPFTLRILTVDGRVVNMAKGDFATAANLTRQAFDAAQAGIYILSIESPAGIERHRLVKQ